MSSYAFPNRRPLSYSNLTENLKHENAHKAQMLTSLNVSMFIMVITVDVFDT